MVVVRIDLHTHSTASDGTDGPAELVSVAAAAGLDVIALTDHDTTAGWRPAAEALPSGMRLVPGAELSCECADGEGGRVSVHLLAYLFDPEAPAIVAEQRRLRDERRTRLRAIADRMAADGLPVDADEILDRLGPDATAGRPHVAQALVRAGLCATVDEAFAGYLAGGRGYYVPRTDTPVTDAIEMISAAGGVTVLAHPFAFGRRPTVPPEVIAELAQRGLTGIEVDHPNHEPDARDELRALAKDLGLVRTGSSDYHGTNKTIRIGQETTAVEEFEALVAQSTGAPVEVG
ncbi:phosphatase [Saccharomonospora sp. CUA-673]|uniref:PHP domain-containing protein n=1 Tax=Saccharomonospora sp. CUA-673 TaxID=1904969 RepID=UPI00095BE468|nr:PHP domain-containing protein [Saccharomonospora sp. CUA-673]OLT48205.1 phosphatase [Saccharomonospora sp. CUA-673]